MNPEITFILALLIAISSLIIALYALFSPAIRSATRIKTPGTIEFPENPDPDQIHTSAGKTWRWTGRGWKLIPKP
jgi:hypothetical protein